MLSCLFKIHKHFSFFIFVTFCAFQAVFASVYRSFLYKIAWPKWWWQLEFPKLYSWYWHVVVGLWKVSILTVENSSIDCCSRLSLLWTEEFDGTGTSKSQSLGSLQQVVDEFLKIDKCKIYSTVNCEVNTNVFVHSRLWFLWKTWSYWGCPGKKI